MMTGSDGVSFLLPQLFLSQQRLKRERQHSIKQCAINYFRYDCSLAYLLGLGSFITVSYYEVQVEFTYYKDKVRNHYKSSKDI